MIRKILALFRSERIDLRERFLDRFAGRTIIVHQGLTIGWVGELMKEAGGGAHFRFDARTLPAKRPTPIEWMVERHVLPLCLPMPLLIKIDGRNLLIRHLMRNGMPVHPSEIYWMLGEFPERTHIVLSASGQGFKISRKMPVSDNLVDFNAIFEESAEY